MPSVQGFKEVPTYELEILVAVSAVIQTVIFGYHLASFDCKYENSKTVDCFSLFLLVFFIMAILITTLGYKWTVIDLTLHSFENPNLQNLIYYIGIALLYVANALFVWIEYYLHSGIQSPFLDNDINMHRIQLSNKNIVELQTVRMEESMKHDKVRNRKLITSGPFRLCRHPIVPIMLSWELGYGLATGAWFEFLAFVSFVSVELLHIVAIEKSLLYHYGEEYYEYMRSKNAFCPTALGGKLCCEMGLFDQSCVCLCRYGDCKMEDKIATPQELLLKVQGSAKTKRKVMDASYGSVQHTQVDSV